MSEAPGATLIERLYAAAVGVVSLVLTAREIKRKGMASAKDQTDSDLDARLNLASCPAMRLR